jgi:sorting nexin-4
LDRNWAEPLNEYSQFALIIKKLLAYRHQKHVQYEMTQDSLVNKREQLEELEKSEREARRLEEALGRGRLNTQPSQQDSSQTQTPAVPSNPESEGDEAEPVQPSESTGGYGQNTSHSWPAALPPHPGPNPARRSTKVPGMALLNALSYTLHGMMDVDPETARRNAITKTRETISQVCL